MTDNPPQPPAPQTGPPSDDPAAPVANEAHPASPPSHAVSPVSETPPTPRPGIWLPVILSLLFLLPGFLLLRGATEPSKRAAIAARHSFIQLDNEEGALLFQSVQIGRGESIYRPLTEPPWFAGTYPPAYMALVALLEHNNEYPAGFTTGRYIVWVSTLVAAAALLLMILMITRNPALGVLTAFLFLATWEVHRWIGYFRVDFLALALSLLGLSLIVLPRPRWWTYFLAAGLMTTALYTKQTVIAAPVASIIALALYRYWRAAAAFTGWMLLWGLPPLLALQISTGGQFLRHIIFFNMNTSHGDSLQVWLMHIWFMHRFFIIAAILALPAIIMLLLSRHRHTQVSSPDNFTISPAPPLLHFWQPLALWALLAQWNIPAAAKAGSAENYLLEPIAGWAALITLATGAGLRLMATQTRPTRRNFATATTILLLIAITLHAKIVSHPSQHFMRFDPNMNPSRLEFEATTDLITLMRTAENPLCELPIYHLLSGNPPVFQPFIMSELARQNRWDQSQFVADIQQKKFDLVITLENVMTAASSTNYTIEMLAAFQSSYELEATLQTPRWTYHVLRPRSDTEPVSIGTSIVALPPPSPTTTSLLSNPPATETTRSAAPSPHVCAAPPSPAFS